MSVHALQQLRVKHLYRRSLKTILNWAIRREIFYEEVLLGNSAQTTASTLRPSQEAEFSDDLVQGRRLRAEFEKTRGLADPFRIERLLVNGESKLNEYLHPDPYIVPYRPGGSLYARNPPWDPRMHQQLNFGKEDW